MLVSSTSITGKEDAWVAPQSVEDENKAEIPRDPRVQPGSALPQAVDSEDDVPASKHRFDKSLLKARNDKVDDLFWMPYRKGFALRGMTEEKEYKEKGSED